jgi:4-amino-4-deoxy-L-arabinose transferase-like glycosyltransferase
MSMRSFILPLLAVLLVALVLDISYALAWTKFSRAEVFFGECAREMIAYNNLVTPLYHAKPFFDKPIFTYWLIVLAYKMFGITHFAARIPSLLAGAATVLLTGFATRCLATSKRDAAGLIASMVLGSSFMFFSFTYLCMSDMFLVLFDTTTMMLLYAGVMQEKKRTLLWMMAAASMGMAFITKGPIGIVLPGAALIAFLVTTKRLGFIKWHHVMLGGIIAGLIAVPWFYAAYKANGTWALAYFFLRENVQRYAAATYDTHKPLWFMLVSLITGFLPWSVFLPGALVNFIAQCKTKTGLPTSAAMPVDHSHMDAGMQEPPAPKSWSLSLAAGGLLADADKDMQRKLYLWTWLLVVTAFFSFSRGKCDYYILPVYPAAAALTALYLTEQTRRAPRILAIALSGTALVAGILSPLLLSAVASGAGLQSLWLMPAALILFGALGLAAALRQHWLSWCVAMFAAVCFAGAGFACQILPVVGQSQSLDVYARAMRQTPPYTRIGVHNGLGHWIDELTFQVCRDPIELSDTASITQFFQQGPGMALIPEKNYERALAESPALRAIPLSVLDRRMVSSHPLTPGYVFQRKGNLYDTTLLLLSNI